MKEAKPGEVVLEGGNATVGAPVIKVVLRSENQPKAPEKGDGKEDSAEKADGK